MTIDEKIKNTNVTAPPGWLYGLLMGVTRVLNSMSNTHFTYKARPAEEPGPIVMIANHASRVDYQFTGPVCYPKKLNYVVGYNEFFRFPTSILLPYMQVIPKKNFTPDTLAMRQILLLREIQGLSYEEIADTLDLEVGTVKSRIFRARKRLCTFLIEDGNIPDSTASVKMKGGEKQ